MKRIAFCIFLEEHSLLNKSDYFGDEASAEYQVDSTELVKTVSIVWHKD